jgi:hypothetical protein
LSDATIDKLSFIDVAHVIAPPLAEQKYLPAKDPKATKLLIMVYWGTTVSSSDDYRTALEQFQMLLEEAKMNPREYESIMQSALAQIAMADRLRDRTNFTNAKMLGYDSEGLIGTDYGN